MQMRKLWIPCSAKENTRIMLIAAIPRERLVGFLANAAPVPTSARIGAPSGAGIAVGRGMVVRTRLDGESVSAGIG